MRSARSGQVQAHMDAPPERVWVLLADVEQMGSRTRALPRPRLGEASSPTVRQLVRRVPPAPGGERSSAGWAAATLMSLHEQQREASLDKRRGHGPRLTAQGTGCRPLPEPQDLTYRTTVATSNRLVGRERLPPWRGRDMVTVAHAADSGQMDRSVQAVRHDDRHGQRGRCST